MCIRDRKYTLEIKPLENYSKEEILKLAEKRTRRLKEDKWAKNQKFLGRKAVLNQAKKGTFPKETNRTNRPACYTKCKKVLAEFKERYKLIRAKYDEASKKYRNGLLDYDFPSFCYFPPRHHIPKYVPI